MKTENRASLRSIASHLELSVATVSRALNNDSSVHPETIARVLKAANEMGYASTIGRRVTTSIGLVYASNLNLSEFDAWVLAGMTNGVREQKFDITLIDLERDKAESENFTQFFMRKSLRGVVMRTTFRSRHICRAIADEGFPMVVVADHFEEKNVNFVCYRSQQGSQHAVEHLIELGHERIALVTHAVSDSDHTERFEGYKQAMQKAGLELDPRMIVSVVANMEGGVKAMNQLMSLPQPPTAVYFTDPLTTMGALNRAYVMGVRVPADLSIIGFDDGDTRSRVYLPYAAVCQDASLLGLEASRWLTRSLAGVASGGLRKSLETTFEINATTGLPSSNPQRILPDGTRLPVTSSRAK